MWFLTAYRKFLTLDLLKIQLKNNGSLSVKSYEILMSFAISRGPS